MPRLHKTPQDLRRMVAEVAIVEVVIPEDEAVEEAERVVEVGEAVQEDKVAQREETVVEDF